MVLINGHQAMMMEFGFSVWTLTESDKSGDEN